MEKYLFLDFDGVLNTEQYQAELAIQGKSGKDIYGPLFDYRTVSQLKYILDMTDAKIIVTSSWRFIHRLKVLQEMWANRGMPGELYATLPTEISSKSRGEEITTWMVGRDNRYVILDDEYDFDISQEKYLI